jgi:hypothetical protein
MLYYNSRVDTCQSPLDVVLSRLKGVRRSGKQWTALCPAHDDRHQSLSISEGRDGRVLLKCHAGCDAQAIVRAIGLELRDLFPPTKHKPRAERTSERKPTRVFEIRDVDGKLVALHERYDKPDGKRFGWKLPNGQTGLGGLSTKALPLYGSEKLRHWPGDALVVLCEGEKAAQALLDAGIPALGTVCGASTTPERSVLRPLAGRRVVLWPDNDDAGRAHMSRIAALLLELGADVKWFEWPEAPSGGDAADYIARNGDVHKLQELLASAPEWKPAPAVSYEELRATFSKWLYLSDDTPLRFILCAVIANRLPGDPFWAFLVAPSGSAKTELLNALTGLEFVRPLDQLTTNTFLSGKQRKDPNASLLLRVPNGTIFLMRDFTSVLEMHTERRAEIFAQLRKIYDGHLTKCTGEVGESAELHWEGKVGLIAGVTPAIEGYRAFANTLGERFLYYYLPVSDRNAAAQRALRNRENLRAMREELRQAVKSFLDGLPIPEHVEMGQDIGRWIVHIADFVSVARTGVSRDHYSSTRDILDLPDPEVPTRLAQQLGALACAHAVLCGRACVTPDDLDLVAQTALACIPTRRRLIIKTLVEAQTDMETSAIAEKLDLPTATVRRDLEDLTALKLAKRTKVGSGQADLWEATDLAVLGWLALTQAGKRVTVQNPVLDVREGTLSEKPRCECTGESIEEGEGLCLVRGFSDKVAGPASGTQKPTFTQMPDEDSDDEDGPF